MKSGNKHSMVAGRTLFLQPFAVAMLIHDANVPCRPSTRMFWPTLWLLMSRAALALQDCSEGCELGFGNLFLKTLTSELCFGVGTAHLDQASSHLVA